MWNGLGWLVLVTAGVGCHSYEPHLRPPKPVETYNAPPDDPRYQQPPKYPPELLNKDGVKQPNADGNSSQNKGLNRPSFSGGGTGGP
jgi:hypothetical protein